ncbi:hypothetical protein AAF712_008330, partial [Marasmius tenuissimus]
YIDHVGFRLTGTFLEDARRTMPHQHTYSFRLFVQNSLTTCTVFSLPRGVFYWSHDPQGRDAIPEEDWEEFGIPKLTVEEWIGSNWEEENYATVREHLDSLDYDLDGWEYACEHGYPELIVGDPHGIEDIAYSDSELDCSSSPSRSQLTSPSSSSIVEEPTESQCDLEREDAPALPKEGEGTATHWAKRGFLNKWCTYIFHVHVHILRD